MSLALTFPTTASRASWRRGVDDLTTVAEEAAVESQQHVSTEPAERQRTKGYRGSHRRRRGLLRRLVPGKVTLLVAGVLLSQATATAALVLAATGTTLS